MAANRKGLCVEEECPDDRRKQQIVVGLLAACTLRLLQRGPDVNVCGEIVELSAMVGSPFPCSQFIMPNNHQTLPQGSAGRSITQPLQLPHPEPLQQQHGSGTPNRGVKHLSGPPSGQPFDAASIDRQQQSQQDEGSIVLRNFPDVLEGYGGVLLLPNLQQRTDCLLSVAPSTATISGRL